MRRSDSRSSFRSTSTFQGRRGCMGGDPALGSVLWCGQGNAAEIQRHLRCCVLQVVLCRPEDFLEKYSATVYVVAVAFAGQPLDVVEKLSSIARRYVYDMGIAVPVYAATARDHSAAFRSVDVVADADNWEELARQLNFKLLPREPKTNIIWCDPAAHSPTMRQMVLPLEKLGVQVEFVEHPDELVCRATEDTAAVITSMRGLTSLPTIREKLQDDRARPLYWVVSLSGTTQACYDGGADAAIVCDNDGLRLHHEHLQRSQPGCPWMWSVVVGDVLAVLQATGVAGTGSVQWSLPKRYDDLDWRRTNMSILVHRGERVFNLLAQKLNFTIKTMGPNPQMQVHEGPFHAEKASLSGYVRDRMLYHGTSEEAASNILQQGLRPSRAGMYGPGCYLVDPTGLAKAAFFAMSNENRRDSSRVLRTSRQRGAIVAFRVAMCQTQIVTELDGARWFQTRTPCESGQESLIGICETGYNGCGNQHCSATDRELNEIPEYVIRNPQLCVPIGMAVFERQ